MIRPENVPVTVDILIRLNGKLVLIERKNPPHGWAIPGGFVEKGESLHDAARREALEETGLDVKLCVQLFAYGKPGRDPRGSVVSVCFIGDAEGTPVAADDAKNFMLIDPFKPSTWPQMAFDHATVLCDYIQFMKLGERPRPYEG